MNPVALATLPQSQAEATNAMIHYYRAEMGRMNYWRSRLDLTTNWAITVMAAMLSVTLSTPSAHHGLVLFAMVILMLLLGVEARRYRFFDVYRMRVRQFERHYFAQFFGPEPQAGAEPWLQMLAQDLKHPRFRITFWRAMGRRLRRNYIWMFLILLLAWLLKIASPDLQSGVHLDPVRPVATLVAQASTGPVPGWFMVGIVAVFYAVLLFVAYSSRERGGDEVRV
ncbi:membrane protein [Devosia soli]|uniref:Membrane protein n=2 Tax=Devosia soli TaxID=361041 RepID=A0A0F5L9U9_9HYPH|nr:membrane protein [Devosia soli]